VSLTFSVIVPAFNNAATLPSTLESVVMQTYPAREVIVIDDGSTDETAAVASAFGAPVTVIRKANGGTASARNAGIRQAKGDVIAFLDADDLYEPDRLARIAARFAAEPTLDAVATDALLTSPERTFAVSDGWPAKGSRTHVDLFTPIIFCALAIRRPVLRELGEFDSRYTLLEDAEMFYRLLFGGRTIGWEGSGGRYVYRLHEHSKTGRPSGRAHREHAEINLRYALGRRTPISARPRLLIRGLRHVRALRRAT